MQKSTDISARVSEIIEYLNITPNKFAKGLGYSRSQTVHDIVSGRVSPSYDFLMRFMLSEYSVMFNCEWIITGRGEMLREKNAQNNAITLSRPESSACIGCQEKERLIESQDERISELKDIITILKKVNMPADSGEKKENTHT
jgi:hypothetical protein